MAKSKLFRNLKKGDKFRVSREDGVSAVVTVESVHETRKAWFSGRRQWQVNGDYPWWWPTAIRAYSNERVDLL